MWGWLAAGIATALLAPAAASANNITVDSTADPTAAGCTIHDAITAANTNAVVAGSSCLAGSGTDTIDFNLPNPSTITLAGALPDITTDMNIVGPGAGQLTIDGTDLYRPFHVLSGHTDSISGVMLTNGFCPAACNGAQGGAIFNAGTLTLTGVVITGNLATVTGGTNAFPEGGGIRSANGATLHLVLSSVTSNQSVASGATTNNFPLGGAIANGNGTLTIDRSTISGNQATGSGGTFAQASGGGISTAGPVTITQSTIGGNTASASGGATATSASGGGISSGNLPGVTITLDRATLTGNSASGPPGGSAAGGIDAYGSAFTVTSSTISGNSASLDANIQFHLVSGVAFKNTIVSNPLGGGVNCSAPSANSQGFNLESTNSCGFTQPTDKPNTNPMLDAALADNGGPTQTLALLTGSPAIDQGLSSLCPTSDQRGLARPSDFTSIANAAGGDGTDIGAFEVQAPPPDSTPACPSPPGSTPTGSTLDTTAPDTSLSARIRKRKRKATFTFGGTEAGSSFMCKLDKRAFAPCTSPVTFKHLRIGRHTFAVEAKDVAGNVDPAPATFRFKLKP